jgi:mono/diheme cytochrome c family protein
VTTGSQLWTTKTGASIVAPITAYSVDDQERLAVIVGQAGNQQTPNVPRAAGSRVLVYGLGPTTPIVNGLQGQTAQRSPSGAGESAPAAPVTTDSLPYTPAQVASGAAVYASSCASCHGAQLQGVAGPALTGAAVARTHPSVSQIRTTVTTLMPLSAPGSLTPAQYAAVMAYMLAYDCIRPSGGGKTPFPTTDIPALAKVAIGPSTCPQR